MPLRRAWRCNGRSSPPTPGPSARLLQLMICRTGLALPKFRRFATSQVVLAARGACLHVRARLHASCRWFRSPPQSLTKGTRVWFPPGVSDPPGSLKRCRRWGQEGGRAHSPLAAAGVSQLRSEGLNPQQWPTALQKPEAACLDHALLRCFTDSSPLQDCTASTKNASMQPGLSRARTCRAQSPGRRCSCPGSCGR